MAKIWIVVKIDHYGGDMLDCWCTFDNFDGLEVFRSEREAQDYANAYEKQTYAASAKIIAKEI